MLNITDVPGLERTWLASAGPGAFGLGQKWLENFYTAYDSEYTLFFFFFLFFLFFTFFSIFFLFFYFFFFLFLNTRTYLLTHLNFFFSSEKESYVGFSFFLFFFLFLKSIDPFFFFVRCRFCSFEPRLLKNGPKTLKRYDSDISSCYIH